MLIRRNVRLCWKVKLGVFVALVVNGDMVVSGSYDQDARVWSLERRECIHVLKGHEDKKFGVAFDGKKVLTGSLDRSSRVWDTVTGYAS